MTDSIYKLLCLCSSEVNHGIYEDPKLGPWLSKNNHRIFVVREEDSFALHAFVPLELTDEVGSGTSDLIWPGLREDVERYFRESKTLNLPRFD